MADKDKQTDLFAQDQPKTPGLPGLRYQPDFLSHEEEARLLAFIAQLPLAQADYKGYMARRKVLSFGGSYDFSANALRKAAPLIDELHPLRDKVAAWAGFTPSALHHALVAHYPIGAPLGWHRDVPDFEDVFGVSLGAQAVMRFRPYPPLSPKPRDIQRLVLAPRSIYALQGPARWAWQHSVAAVEAPRWSITFRTSRAPLAPPPY